MKFLIFGDVVAKIGRKAVAATLPQLKIEYQPDIVIANVENIAHGAGVTEKTLKELMDAGIDVFTSGNHVWDNKIVDEIFAKGEIPLIRPLNYSRANPGAGTKIVELANKKIIIVNAQCRVFMKDLVENPFLALEDLLNTQEAKEADAIIVDLHGEATSEKVAFGWFADGKVSVVYGTHSHVPTADARILHNGTAYITDVGMTGLRDGVIGIERQGVIQSYLRGILAKSEILETGIAQVNAIYTEVDTNTKKAVQLKYIHKELTIDS
jgi:metallophosphoesterase (TIGR00282 family)